MIFATKTELLRAVNVLNQVIEKVGILFDENNRRKAELRTYFEETESQLSDIRSQQFKDVEALAGRISALEEQDKKLQLIAPEQDAFNREILERIESLDRRIRELSSISSDHGSRLTNQHNRAEGFDRQIETLQERAIQSSADITTLKERSEANKNNHLSLNARMGVMNSRIQALEEEYLRELEESK